jgi:hypothetical protein
MLVMAAAGHGSTLAKLVAAAGHGSRRAAADQHRR